MTLKMKKEKFIVIKSYPFSNNKELLKLFKKKKIITNMWIENFLKKNNKKIKNNLFPCKLFRLNLKKDLGIKKPSYLRNIYKVIKKKGYKLVEPEVAIYARLLYKQKNPGEWIRFATPLKAMIDVDGIPHLPKIGYGLNNYFIETYWAYPKAIFHPKNDFIVKGK